MKNFVIAGLASLSLGLASPTPVVADTDDVAKVIAGIALLSILGSAISSGAEAEVRAEPRYTVPDPRPNPRPRYHQQTRELPIQCLRGVATQRGPVDIYGQRCLMKNYRDTWRLPANCRVEIRGVHGESQGFTPECLSRYGYRTARR